jgi:hypothetical protein
MGVRKLYLVVVTMACLVAAPAHATPPGHNGKIAYSDGGDIWVINPDGTAKTQLTSGSETDFGPDWSPDGARIAFARQVSGADSVYVMDADGSNVELITTDGREPRWSPDGTRIAYSHGPYFGSRIWTVEADGSNPSDLPINGFYTEDERWPHWSPDGTEIAFYKCGDPDICDYPWNHDFSIVPSGGGTHTSFGLGWALDWSPDGRYILQSMYGEEMSTIRREDGETEHYFIRYGPVYASWSPDGTKMVVDDPGGTNEITVIDADGQNPIPLGPGGAPDWQSIPVNAYPRPKGASPTDVSLVPAHEPCDASTSANRTHGPPLAFPSCAPPTQKPGQLTVGTPDANGQPAKLRSNVRINPLRGLPSTPADEADVRLRATVNDVRLRSDLSDYTGDLELRLALQITDRDNTPHPGGPGPATVQELTHSHPLPCSATADTTVGSTCQFDTTIEALVPGAVKELQRAIWELKRIAVHDGAGNLFLTQGVFVP